MEKIKKGLGNVFDFYKEKITKLNTEVLIDIEVGETLNTQEEKKIRILSGNFYLKISDGTFIIKNNSNNKNLEISGVKKVVFMEDYIEVFTSTDNNILGIKNWNWHISYKKLFNNLR